MLVERNFAQTVCKMAIGLVTVMVLAMQRSTNTHERVIREKGKRRKARKRTTILRTVGRQTQITRH